MQDMNLITYHMLSVIHTHLLMNHSSGAHTHINREIYRNTNNYHNFNKAFVEKVFNIISSNNVGVSVKFIVHHLVNREGSCNINDIRMIVQSLINDGFIIVNSGYNKTGDDQTYISSI